LASLQQENAALSARLRQAQGTLDQIASAARLMNPGATSAASTPTSRPAVDTSQAPRYHTVVEGDSLSRISLRYYGTANRWQEIYEANRDVLSRENVLRPGQRLQLP
jgi:nucleoid-associated protein YgaU